MWTQACARARATWRSLGCSPSETLALAVLSAGAIAAVGVLWLANTPGYDLPFGLGNATLADAAPPPAGDSISPAPSGAPPADPDGDGLTLADAPLTVHVAGAVTTPGLIDLPGGSRVADALQAAGGPLETAALDAVNLARPLNDGEQLYIPDATATEGPANGDAPPDAGEGPSAPGASSAHRPDGTLDLNRADASDFEELPGVGPVLAERITDHRDAIGGFTSVGELRDVAGIGEVRFQELSELVGL